MESIELTEDGLADFATMLAEDEGVLKQAARICKRSQEGNMKSWRENDGKLIHDGDCHFWNCNICTCGLIHHLMSKHDSEKWYGKKWGLDAWGMHERQLERVPKPLPYAEPTKEEMEERTKIIDEVFGEGSGKRILNDATQCSNDVAQMMKR